MKTKAFKKPISVFLSLIMVLSMFSVLGAVSYAAIDGVPTRTDAIAQNYYPDATLYGAEKWDKTTGRETLTFNWSAYSSSLGFDPQPGRLIFEYPSHMYLNVGETLEAAGYMGHMTASYGENDGSDVTDFRVMLSSATWGESTRTNFSPISQLISNYGHQGTCTEGTKLMTGSSSHYDFSNDGRGSDQIISDKSGDNENFLKNNESVVVWRSNIQWTGSEMNNFDEYVLFTGTASKTGEVTFNPTSNFTIGAAQRYTAFAWHSDNGSRLNRSLFNNGERPECAPAENALSITVTVYDKTELNRLIKAADDGILTVDADALAAARAVLADREVTQAEIDAAAALIGDRMTVLVNEHAPDYSSSAADTGLGTAANTFDAQAFHQGAATVGAYSNLVYAPIWSTSWSGNGVGDVAWGVGRIDFKVAIPRNVVMVYDGVHEAYAPITLESRCNDTGGSSHIIHYADYDNGSSLYEVKNDFWQGYSTQWDVWAKDNIAYTEQFAAYWHDGGAPGESPDSQRDGNSRFWWNIIQYFGEGNTVSYYDHESNFAFGAKTSYKNTSRQYKYGTFTSKTDFYTVNYQPIYSKLAEAAAVKTIIENPDENWKYTEASITRAKATIAAMIASNPKNFYNNNTKFSDDYDADSAAVAAAVANNGAAISDAKYMIDHDGLVLVKKQGTVTFVDQLGNTLTINGSPATYTRDYGSTVAANEIPQLSNVYYRTDNAQWDYGETLTWEPALPTTILFDQPEQIFRINDEQTVQTYVVRFYNEGSNVELTKKQFDPDSGEYVDVTATKAWQYGDYPDWGSDYPPEKEQDYDYNYTFDHWVDLEGETYGLNDVLRPFTVDPVAGSTRADLETDLMTKYYAVYTSTERTDADYVAYQAALEAAEAVRDTPGIDAPTALAIQAIITTEIARAHDDQGRNYRSDDEDGVADIAIAVQNLLAIVADYTDGEGNLKDEYKANYTVTFYAEDGETMLGTKADYHYGDAPEAPEAPVKATAQYTYTFLGWSDGENTYAPEAIPAVTANVTYTAVFDTEHPVTNTYTVRFFDLDDNQIGEDQEVEYGASAVAPDLPVKDPTATHHYIVIWGNEDWKNVTSNVNVYAVLTSAPHVWDYANASYVWTGYTACTATVPCTGCDKTKVYESTSVTDVTSEPWDCLHEGTKTYTAHFEVNDLSATATEELGYGPHSLTHNAAVQGIDCLHEGTVENWYCSICETYYAEETCETAITDLSDHTAGPHSLTHNSAVQGVDCMHYGTVENWYCSTCVTYFAEEAAETVLTDLSDNTYGPHSWGDWTVTVIPTCAAEGEAQRVCAVNAEHIGTVRLQPLANNAAEVTVDPTEETPGTLIISAVKDDEDNVIATNIPVTIPALNDADYELYYTYAGTCTQPGAKYYSWNGNAAYNVYVTIEVSTGTVSGAHSYSDEPNEVVPPVQDPDTGEWSKGTFVFYCFYTTQTVGDELIRDETHDKTEEVDRANYTEYDAALDDLKDLLDTDLHDYNLDLELEFEDEEGNPYTMTLGEFLEELALSIEDIEENFPQDYVTTTAYPDYDKQPYVDEMADALREMLIDYEGLIAELGEDAYKHYTVTFTAGETVIAEYSKIKGAEVAVPEAPAMVDGYVFEGWTLDGTTVALAADAATYTVTGNAAFTAKYSDTATIVAITWVNAGEPAETDVVYGETPTHALPEKADDEYYTYSYAWDPAIVPATEPATYTAVESKTWNEEKQAVIDAGEELVDEHAAEYDPEYVEDIEDLLEIVNDETKSDEEREEALDDLETLLAEQAQAEHKYYTITWVDAGEPATTSVLYGETPTHELPTKADDEYYKYSYTWDPAIVPATEPATYTAVESKTWNEEKQAVIDAGEELVDEHAAEYDPEYVEDIEDLLEIVNDETKSDEEREEALDDLEALLAEQAQAEHKYYTITWVNAGEPAETEVLYGETPTHDLPAKDDDDYYTYSYAWDPAIVAVTGEATYTAVESKTWNEEKQAIIDAGEELVDEHADEYDPEYVEDIEDLLAIINDETQSDEDREDALDDLEELLSEQAQAEHKYYTITWVNAGEPAETSVLYGETPAHDLPAKDDDEYYTYSYDWDPAIVAVTGEATYTAVEIKTWNEEKQAIIDEAEDLLDEHADEYDPEYVEDIEDLLAIINDETQSDEDREEALDDLEDLLDEATQAEHRFYTVTWNNAGEPAATSVHYGDTPAHDLPAKDDDTLYTYSYAWDRAFAPVTEDTTYTAIETKTYNEHVLEVIEEAEELVDEHADEYDDGYIDEIEHDLEVLDDPDATDEEKEEALADLEEKLSEEGKEENRLHTLTVVYGNGAENKTLKGKAGASVTIDEAYPVREGYAFTGWTADKGTVNDKTYTFVSDDATVTAGWYDLTHVNEVIDDGEDVIADDDYDDEYQQQIEDLIDEIEDLIDNPPVDPETLEDLIEELEDLLDEATKEENKLYTLTVVVSGVTVATYRQKAGTTKVLQPPTAPEKYVFTGWTADVGTVTGATYTFVAADATVTAVFELDSRVIDDLIGQAEDILAEGDEVYEEDYLEELEEKLNELKDAVENGADEETVKTLLDELEALINEAENNKHVWGPWEILEPADYGVTGTEIRYCQHDGCTHFQTRPYEISEARDREIQFTHTKGTYFIAHLGSTDYYAYVDGKVIKWYSGATVNFDVVVTPEFRYEKYVVFMNGNVIEPNADGSFTIPAGCDRAVITVVGAYEGGSESGSEEPSSGSGVCKLCGQDHGNTIWGRIVAFIHMIIYFFKNLFR